MPRVPALLLLLLAGAALAAAVSCPQGLVPVSDAASLRSTGVSAFQSHANEFCNLMPVFVTQTHYFHTCELNAIGITLGGVAVGARRRCHRRPGSAPRPASPEASSPFHTHTPSPPPPAAAAIVAECASADRTTVQFSLTFDSPCNNSQPVTTTMTVNTKPSPCTREYDPKLAKW